MAKENNSTNLEKACDLLLIMSQSANPVSVADLSTKLNVSRTTAYAMLASLQSRGFVERNADGRYMNGYALLRLADGYQRMYPFLPLAEAHMRTLARLWEQSVMITVYKSPCHLVMLRSVSELPQQVPIPRMSGVMNAMLVSGGRLLMATLTDEQLRADLDVGPMELLLPQHPYDKEQMYQEIIACRGARYVIERNEYSLGRGSIAAPVYDQQGTIIAAICSPVDLTTLTPEMEQKLAMDITTTAMRISAEIGYPVAII